MPSLFIIQVLLAASLLSFHFFALQHELYWHYLWLDIPMHFLGGLWAALASIWFVRRTPVPVSVISVFAGVIAIGIGWEVLEFAIGFQREQNYVFDTTLDLLMDLCGGALGYGIIRWNIYRDTMTTHDAESSSS